MDYWVGVGVEYLKRARIFGRRAVVVVVDVYGVWPDPIRGKLSGPHF